MHIMVHFSTSVCIIFMITSVHAGEDFISPNESHRDSLRPIGEPLFLTPLIKEGQTVLAQELARVNLPGIADESYSGFITVNKKYNSNLFFWYFPAKNMVYEAPVLLWLTGGPGVPTYFAIFFQSGPFYLGNDQKLRPRHLSWTNIAHIIYVDNPVGTGYSFTEDPAGYARNQEDVGRDLYNFLLQFFQLFSNLRRNKFFIIGESYGGKYAPAIGYTIHMNNNNRRTKINLQGILIGNGFSDPEHMLVHGEFLYQIGLVDSHGKLIIETAEKNAVKLIKQKRFTEASTILYELILGENNTIFSNLTGFKSAFNYLYTDLYGAYLKQYDVYAFVQTPDIRRRIHVANSKFDSSIAVREALFADLTNTTKPWIEVLVEYYKILFYNGQLDILVPYPATENFLKHLKWSGTQKWRKAPRKFWYVLNKLAGYSKTVKKLTEVLVRNAGHLTSVDQPLWSYELFKKFVTGQSF